MQIEYENANKRHVRQNGMISTQLRIRGRWVEIGAFPERPVPLPLGVKVVGKSS